MKPGKLSNEVGPPLIAVSHPLLTPLDLYTSLVIEIVPGDSVKRDSDFETVRENLINAIATKLPGRTNLSMADAQPPAGDTLALKILVKRLQYTSQAARVAVGIMAGNAELFTDIELSDKQTGKLLWRASTEARSGKQGGIFGASTTTQIEELSELIVIYLALAVR